MLVCSAKKLSCLVFWSTSENCIIETEMGDEMAVLLKTEVNTYYVEYVIFFIPIASETCSDY